MATEITVPKQRGRPFQPGQSGNPNGRPKGAKQKLANVFLNALAQDFAENGLDAIAKLRAIHPAAYLRIIANLIPREVILQREQEPDIDYDELTNEEAVAIIEQARRRLFLKRVIETVQS